MKQNTFSILCCKEIFSFDLTDLTQGGKNFKCPCGTIYWIPQKKVQNHYKENTIDSKKNLETGN